MRALQTVLFALLALALAACGAAQTAKRDAAATPTETVKAFGDAVRRKDYEAVRKLFSKKTLAELERVSSVKLFVDGAREFERGAAATRNEQIVGDKASVEVKDPAYQGEEKWTTLKFVREDGVWKISRSGD